MPRQTDDCPFFQLSVQAWASNAPEYSLAHIVKSENAESEMIRCWNNTKLDRDLLQVTESVISRKIFYVSFF